VSKSAPGATLYVAIRPLWRSWLSWPAVWRCLSLPEMRCGHRLHDAPFVSYLTLCGLLTLLSVCRQVDGPARVRSSWKGERCNGAQGA